MKILILLSLFGLIACGKLTPRKGVQPITDIKDHIKMANEYIKKNGYEEDEGRRGTDVTVRVVEKYITMMGKGWVVIKEVFTPGGSTPGTPRYYGLNLERMNFDTNMPIPSTDGDFDFTEVINLTEVSAGVFAIKVDEGNAIYGYYEIDGIEGQVHFDAGGGISNLNDPVIFEVSDNINGGFATSTRLTAADFGVEGPFTGEDFYFSEDVDSKKDLENIASAIEAEELTQYGLSIKTAKIVKTLAKTAGKRALSKREKDMFAKELTGMSFDKAAEQMVDDYEGLLEKAAELNETSPEAIKELINTIM